VEAAVAVGEPLTATEVMEVLQLMAEVVVLVAQELRMVQMAVLDLPGALALPLAVMAETVMEVLQLMAEMVAAMRVVVVVGSAGLAALH